MDPHDGFSDSRKPIDIHDLDLATGVKVKLLHYPNVSRMIGLIVSSGKATLHELDTVYSIEDAYDLLEISIIDSQNRRNMEKA